MAPEEWTRGATIDECTTSIDLGRTLHHLTRPGRLHTVVGNESTIARYRSPGWVLPDHVVTSVVYGMVYVEHVLLKTLR